MTDINTFDLNAIRQGKTYPIRAHVAPGFEGFASAFLNNFRYDEDQGASACAFVDGVMVAEAWGGFRDAKQQTPWASDTLVCTMSVGKAIAAAAVHLLCERGELRLDDPIASYWPEFGQRGKEKILLRWVLDHRAGLPAIDDEDPPPGALFDWEWMTKHLAGQAPEFEPGTAAGYHILTQGFLLGEVVRRATGKTLAEFVHEEFGKKLNADFFFGVPASEITRCAEVVGMTDPRFTMFDRTLNHKGSLVGRGILNLLEGVDLNGTQYRTSEITSANGHGSARGLATIFSMLANAGVHNEQQIMGAQSIRNMNTVQHTLIESVQKRAYNQCSGALRTSYPATWFGPGANSFGHHGVGGSVGFSDPDKRVGFAYATSKFHSRGDTGTRSRRLIEAIYEAIEK
ncbi:MAG: serine hydrolase domain-containing protein [Pseudomonadota bacterium]